MRPSSPYFFPLAAPIVLVFFLARVVSIGGAGTFDGIFTTGIFAVLLA